MAVSDKTFFILTFPMLLVINIAKKVGALKSIFKYKNVDKHNYALESHSNRIRNLEFSRSSPI